MPRAFRKAAPGAMPGLSAAGGLTSGCPAAGVTPLAGLSGRPMISLLPAVVRRLRPALNVPAFGQIVLGPAGVRVR